MASAKDIHVAPISAEAATRLVKRFHYSGKVVQNSQLHLGVYLEGRCLGAMSFGPPMAKHNVIGLVRGSGWNEVVELNRMAFGDELPRNSESRALAVAWRLMKKHCPHVKWVLSFSDGTQCGDGTIYRASGFVLTQIKENQHLVRLPSGHTIHKMSLSNDPTRPRAELGGKSMSQLTGGSIDMDAYCRATGAEVIAGYQLRYIKFLDPEYRKRLTVPEVPYSAIKERGAGMYRGQKTSAVEASCDAPGDQLGEGGSTPTPPLHSSGE